MSESKQERTPRFMQGVVVSSKMDKTIVVLIERKIPHPKYGKYVKHSSKIHAHDEENQCSEGDVVVIRETRPLSKNKTWVLDSIKDKVA